MSPRSASTATALKMEAVAKRPYSRIYTTTLHPGMVNIIAQVRKTYLRESIDALADSIASLGMIQLPTIAELTTRTKAEAYVAHFNLGLGSDTRVVNLVPDIETKHYFVVIFGHRRTMANLVLFERGCSDCIEANDADLRCVEQHVNLSPEGMEVRVMVDPDPTFALNIQITENTAEPLTIDVITDRLRQNWTIEKRLNPQLTMASFARSRNQRPDFVRNALAFCELPPEVIAATTNKHISFTAAVELSRLQAAGFSKVDILRRFMIIVAERMKTADVRTYITAIIKDRVNPEAISLFGDDALMDFGLTEKLTRAALQTAANAAGSDVRALRETLRAIEAGILPPTDLGLCPAVMRTLANGDDLRHIIQSPSA